MKIGYQGVQGAYSDMAVRNYFGGSVYEECCYSNFIDMFKDVESGELDYALFPVENTTTGIITRTYDYFQFYNIHAVGEIVVPVKHCLIGFPGTDPKDIREVYSHPEALSQCQVFFDEHPWMKSAAYEDTALSVGYIKEQGDRTKAALASSLAAELYGMEILMEEVQDNDANMTRFLCVCNHEEYPGNADKISIRMVTGHTPGALYNALGIFASLGINVLKLESRPIMGKAFEYCFYLDFAGSMREPNVKEALRRLEYDCRELNVFGCYKSDPMAL